MVLKNVIWLSSDVSLEIPETGLLLKVALKEFKMSKNQLCNLCVIFGRLPTNRICPHMGLKT